MTIALMIEPSNWNRAPDEAPGKENIIIEATVDDAEGTGIVVSIGGGMVWISSDFRRLEAGIYCKTGVYAVLLTNQNIGGIIVDGQLVSSGPLPADRDGKNRGASRSFVRRMLRCTVNASGANLGDEELNDVVPASQLVHPHKDMETQRNAAAELSRIAAKLTATSSSAPAESRRYRPISLITIDNCPYVCIRRLCIVQCPERYRIDSFPKSFIMALRPHYQRLILNCPLLTSPIRRQRLLHELRLG